MPLNIPNVDTSNWGNFLEAMSTGNNIQAQRKHAQHQQMQLQQQHQHHVEDLALRKQQQERLAQEFQQDMLYKNATAQRQASLFPLQQQLYEAKIQAANAAAQAKDPATRLNYIKQLMQLDQQSQMLSGSDQGQAYSGMQPTNADMNQSGSPQPVKPPQPSQINFGGINPYVAAEIEKTTGYNPNNSPEVKDARNFDLFKKKEEYKNNKDFTKPTPKTISAAQSTIVGSNTVLPLIQDILKEEIPSAWTGEIFSPTQNAAIQAMQNLSADEMMSIFNLAKDSHSTKLVEQMIKRQKGEKVDAYKTRVKYLVRRIEHKRDLADKLLRTGKVEITNAHNDVSSSNDNDPLGIL